ncbi:unnamed protein product, partial [Rotaria sordida]
MSTDGLGLSLITSSSIALSIIDSTVLELFENSTSSSNVIHSTSTITSTYGENFSNTIELNTNPTSESFTTNILTDDSGTHITSYTTSTTSTTSATSTTSSTNETTTELPSSSKTNLALILGLSLGLGIPLLIGIGVGII